MELPVIPFAAYFDYVSHLKGKTHSEQADRWLMQTYGGINPDLDGWVNMEFMGLVNGRNSNLTVEMPYTYDGFTFCRAPRIPGTFYWHFQRALQEDIGKAMKLAVHTCYLGKPEDAEEYRPIAEVTDRLTFHHAEVLVKNFTAVFNQSRPLT